MAFSNQMITREDALNMYKSHIADSSQGYFKSMQKFADSMVPLVGGDSPFSKEGWDKILKSDGLWEKALNLSAEMFRGNQVLQNRYKRLMNNTREVANSTDRTGFGLEGWGGGTAVYSSSEGVFAMGATPFIIGGWLAACRSEEIFQHIDNKNSMSLEFEYNIDYLLVNGDTKLYFPESYRNGSIEGFNKLPKIDWVTPNTKPNGGSSLTYTAPESWCGEDNFILLNNKGESKVSAATGNFITVCGQNKMKVGIEPNIRIVAVKYVQHTDSQSSTDVIKDPNNENVVVKKLNLHYQRSGTRPNERLFESQFTIKNFKVDDGDTRPETLVRVKMNVNLDDGEFTLAVICDDEKVAHHILGLKVEGRFSNEANEFTNIPTEGTDKHQFIRECEYRNYAKVSLNEYMADNFRIGSNNNISYAAYATDKLLQTTLGNREIEAESFLIDNVLDDSIDLDVFELTRKLGGFINNGLSFEIGRFSPGIHLQDYKEGLKTYLIDNLSIAETDIHIPAKIKKEWIFLGYDTLVSKFPEIRYENAVVNLADGKEGSQVNENYGFAVDTKCGFVDSLGRSVRIIGNTDKRWLMRAPNIYGTIKTYSMDYPFLVYYPHAIRMFTAIDADMPNRTAIYIGGREYRGVFAAGAVQLALNGVIGDDGSVINNFDVQMDEAKKGYHVLTKEDE